MWISYNNTVLPKKSLMEMEEIEVYGGWWMIFKLG